MREPAARRPRAAGKLTGIPTTLVWQKHGAHNPSAFHRFVRRASNAKRPASGVGMLIAHDDDEMLEVLYHSLRVFGHRVRIFQRLRRPRHDGKLCEQDRLCHHRFHYAQRDSITLLDRAPAPSDRPPPG